LSGKKTKKVENFDCKLQRIYGAIVNRMLSFNLKNLLKTLYL